jgi:hypothetical protein
MTHDALLAALAPPRLPAALSALSVAEYLALLGIGLALGALVVAALRPLTRARAPRQRLAALRALPVPVRMLALARRLGHLPPALRPAAYGAAEPPSDRRIERIARRARLRLRR